jgi:hypothetical protein
MVRQTKVEYGNGEPGADGAVSGGAGRLSRDIMELGELQLRLLMLDTQAAAAHGRSAVVYAVLAAALALSTLEIALLWVAAALVEWAGWPWVAGLAVAVGVGVLLAAGPLAASLLHLRRGVSMWQRSQRELDKNMAWLKSVLGSPKGSLHSHAHDRSSSQ